MKVNKQEMFKIGLTIVLLVTAISLTLNFGRGSVDNGVTQEAILHINYDNGTHQYIENVNFTLIQTDRGLKAINIKIVDNDLDADR